LNSSLKLIQVKDEHLFIPNAFTPNSDGLNENFKVVQTNMQQFYLKIMNRWGEILFETNNINDGWDGTYKGNAVQADSYLYFVEAKGYSGTEYYRKGSITLIR
jgi:gliding motility-associated-like protein